MKPSIAIHRTLRRSCLLTVAAIGLVGLAGACDSPNKKVWNLYESTTYPTDNDAYYTAPKKANECEFEDLMVPC